MPETLTLLLALDPHEPALCLDPHEPALCLVPAGCSFAEVVEALLRTEADALVLVGPGEEVTP